MKLTERPLNDAKVRIFEVSGSYDWPALLQAISHWLYDTKEFPEAIEFEYGDVDAGVYLSATIYYGTSVCDGYTNPDRDAIRYRVVQALQKAKEEKPWWRRIFT